MIHSTHYFKLDSLPLADGRFMVEELAGTDGIAPRRGNPIYVAGRHGSWDTPNVFDEKTVTLLITVFGTDADGDVTHSQGVEGHLETNKNALFTVLGKSGLIDVRKFVAGDSDESGESPAELQNYARVRRQVTITGNALVWVFLVELVFAYPFWHELPLIEEGSATSHTLTVGGSAPVADMVFTFSGDGTLTWTETSDVITITGSSGAVVVDVGRRLVTESGVLATGLLTSLDAWPEWAAQSTVNLSSTVGVAVDYYNARH